MNQASTASIAEFWITVAFTINYIIGSGFLTIPWAFQKVGNWLSCTVLVIFAVFSMSATFFILEAVERAEICDKYRIEISEMKNLNLRQNSSDEMSLGDDETRVDDEYDALLFNRAKNEVIRKREILELCEYYLGHSFANFYICVLTSFSYGTLWAYSCVFAQSFSSFFPLGSYSYGIYLAIFFGIVVPVSLMELTEQVYLQVASALFRLVMFFLMLISVFGAEIYGRNDFNIDRDFRTMNFDWKEVNFTKIQYIISVAAFAFLFHHGLPSIIHSSNHHRGLNARFVTSIGLCTVAYVLMGVILSWHFGGSIRSSCNLNWENYQISGSPSFLKNSLSSIIRAFVLLFPAIDVTSAFPLNALTLGNSLFFFYYGEKANEMVQNRYRLTAFRLIAAIPPIIGSIFVGELGHIIKYTGIPGLLIIFFFPPILAMQSEKRVKLLGLNPRSKSSNCFTHKLFQVLLIICGIGLVFYVLFTL